MADWRFVPNSAGYRELLKSAGLVKELERRAELVAQQARTAAPVSTGAYRASIKTESAVHPTRAVCHVIGGTDHGLAVEVDHRTLGSSIDAARG